MNRVLLLAALVALEGCVAAEARRPSADAGVRSLYLPNPKLAELPDPQRAPHFCDKSGGCGSWAPLDEEKAKSMTLGWPSKPFPRFKAVYLHAGQEDSIYIVAPDGGVQQLRCEVRGGR